MRLTILDHANTSERVALAFRSFRSGPEQDLVETFLSGLRISIPQGYKCTIFREPRIESGFPDLVFAIWDRALTRVWNRKRADITRDELRLMHYLSQTGPCTTEELKLLKNVVVERSLDKLQEAEMVSLKGGRWRARRLSDNYAVKHIVAIEAKVSNWREGVNQAFHNTWFANTSYVLLPRVPQNTDLNIKHRSMSISLRLPQETTFDFNRLPKRSMPLSYASWQFNEWAWRASLFC